MKVHFIAIGGSVMHQMALALKTKGYQVTGSDDEIFEPARTNLQKGGLLPELPGWFPEKIDASLDAVILGMHAKEANPELQKARSLGVMVYSFPEYVYEQSRDKFRVAIGGSHGKTTTTAMVMHVLQKAGKDFDYLVGAKLQEFDRSVRITGAPLIVCEGDEYPASAIDKRPKFHFLFPHVAVITGIAWDHINVFPTFDLYLEQFSIFIDKIEPGGVLIYNQTDETLTDLVNKHSSTVRKIGYQLPPYRIQGGKTFIELAEVPTGLKIFGDHNLLNLSAAYRVCLEIGLSTSTFLEGISSFTGAAKRLELLSSGPVTNVYRDFAHAPSKVRATVEAVKKQFLSRKLIAVLELHTYSSLNEKFIDQYKGTLEEVDVAAVFYSSHALAIKGLPALSALAVESGFGKQGLAVLQTSQQLEQWLESQDYQHANLLLMSSGNFDGTDIITFADKIVR